MMVTREPDKIRPPRRAFREMNLGRIGVIGLAVTVVIMMSALNIGRILAFVTNSSYTAALAEAGGLRSSDDVRVDGLRVGKVADVSLAGDHVKVTFELSGVRLGDQSRAEVKSDNALGAKYLAIIPGGRGDQRSIPASRTDAGVSVNEELGRLTSATSQINTQQLAASFESMTKVLSDTPAEFRSALDGVSALSGTIASRDAELATLLENAKNLSSILADRNQQITGIVSDGAALFQELDSRQVVLGTLLQNIQAASDELTSLARENKTTLAPALQQLTKAADLLKQYRSTLDFAIKNFGVYARALGESVGSGPFFQAFVSDLASPEGIVTGGTAGIVKDSLGGAL